MQFRAFDLKPEEGVSEIILKQILDEFHKYFQEYVNKIYASLKFLEIKRESSEKIMDFYSRN